jgi:hypothetical protein
VHRDLKPANILVTTEGRVVVLDFGLAWGAEAEGAGAVIVGTPSYMAPEQAAGLPATPASDFYAVGVLLYETLTGSLPFAGDSDSVRTAKRERDAPPVRILEPRVTPDLDALCADLLARDPERRPAGEEILARLAGGFPGARAVAVRPATGTLAEEERAESATPPAPRHPPTSSPTGRARPSRFVGREAELALLRQGFETAGGGQATWISVRGPSGIGKTALVERFLHGLDAATTVLRGRCFDRESVPFKALDGVIDSLSRAVAGRGDEPRIPSETVALARLFPVLRREESWLGRIRRDPSPPRERFREGAAALRALLGELRRQAPVVAVFDDLQWGDLDSLELLEQAFVPPELPPLLLIGIHRDEETRDNPFLARLAAWRSRVSQHLAGFDVELGPLAAGDAQRLASQVLSPTAPTDSELARMIASESAGDPFLVVALASEANTTAAPARPGAKEPALAPIVARRLTRLAPAARRLVEAVAVAGEPLETGLAWSAAGAGPDPSAVVGLCAARLLRVRRIGDRDRIECYHDRIRETVAAALAADDRAGMHERLALGFAARGGDPERLGQHWRLAGQPARALPYVIQAGDRAADALAFGLAARWYGEALALGKDLPEAFDAASRRMLRTKLGRALADAGRSREASREFGLAAEGAPREEARLLRLWAAEQMLRAGKLADGAGAARRVLAEYGLRLPRTRAGGVVAFFWERLRLGVRGLRIADRECPVSPELFGRLRTCQIIATALMTTEPATAAAIARRSLRLALDLGHAGLAAAGLANEALFAAFVPRRGARARALFERAAELADRSGDPYTQAVVAALRGGAAYVRAELDNCCRCVDEAERLMRTLPQSAYWELATLHLIRQASSFYAGHWRSLCERHPREVTECERHEDAQRTYSLRAHFGWLPHLLADDAAGAWAMEERLSAVFPRVASEAGFSDIQWVRAWLHLFAGDAPLAWRALEAARATFERSSMRRVALARAWWLALRGVVARRAARHPQADSATAARLDARARRDARSLQRIDLPFARAMALLVGPVGEPDAGLSELARAEEALWAAELRPWAAAVRRRRGERLGGERGTKLAAEGEAWFREQGARSPGRIADWLLP